MAFGGAGNIVPAPLDLSQRKRRKRDGIRLYLHITARVQVSSRCDAPLRDKPYDEKEA